MPLGDNLEAQLGKPSFESGSVPLVLTNLSYFNISGALTWLLLTTPLGAGMWPVLLHHHSSSLAFSYSECILKHYLIPTVSNQKRLFSPSCSSTSLISKDWTIHIHLLQITSTLSCNIPFLPLLHAALLKEEGRVEKNWKFRRQVNYRKQELISCSVKRKTGKNPSQTTTNKKSWNKSLRPQFGNSSEHLWDAQACKVKEITHLESQIFRHFRLPRSCKILVVAQMINSISTCITVLLNLLSHILSAWQSVNKV